MKSTVFEKTKRGFAEAMEHERDPYCLTTDEMKTEYDGDELCGQYLYKKHTDFGT